MDDLEGAPTGDSPIGAAAASESPEEAQTTDSASDDETNTSASPISRANSTSISMTSLNGATSCAPVPVSISVALQQCRNPSNSIGASSLARPLANSVSLRATSTANHSAAPGMTSLRASKSSCGHTDVNPRFQVHPTAAGDNNSNSSRPPVNLHLMDSSSSGSSGSGNGGTGGGGCIVKCVSPAKNLAPRNRSHQHHNALANRNGGGTTGASSPSPTSHGHSEIPNALSVSAANSSSNSRSNSPRSSVNNHHTSSSIAINGNGTSYATTSAQQSSLANSFNARSSSANQIIPVSSATAAANQNVPFFTNLSTQGTSPNATNTATAVASSPGSSNANGGNMGGNGSSTSSNLQQVLRSPSGAHNWQSMKMSMRERLAFLFNNEIMSDVKFIVGRGVSQQRIPAHKFILSIGSAVFNAMFNGSMATADTEIELPDVEPVAFMFLLKFLYTDEAQIGPETVMTTLYTAKKYAVPALESQCVEFLKRNLNAENAFMLLSQARLFDEQQLADLCLETIDKNTTEAISAEGFVDIDLQTLSSVLKRDTLSIRECKLFQAIVRWADAECQRQQIASSAENKRRVLGDATDLIRFPLMSMEEFASCAQTKILQDREIVNLFLYFTVNPKPNINFFDKPRCYLSGVEYTLNRFRQVDCRWGYSGTPDKIRFRVNQKIHIVGLALYGSTHLPTEYQVNLQIVEDETGKICGDNDTSFSSDGSSNTFRVMFREPVEVRPHNYYTASATIAGADSHYGTKGMRKVHVDTPDGKIVFHFQHSPGNNNGTSVEDGQIPQFIFYT